MMVENFNEIGLIERRDRLAWFIMVNKNDLETRRIEDVALTCDAEVEAALVCYPDFIMLAAQEAVKRIADDRIG